MSEVVELKDFFGSTSLTEDLTNIFPKPLKPVEIKTAIDENGISMIEKSALRNAWRFIEPFKRNIGKLVFYDFLTEYENQIEVFRFGTKIQLHRLHLHAETYINFLDTLIRRCLDSPLLFHSTLQEIMPMHLKCNIEYTTIAKLCMNLQKYLIESKVVEKHCSKTLESAFEKMLKIVGEYNHDEVIRKEQASRKYSMMQLHASYDYERVSDSKDSDTKSSKKRLS